MARDPGSAGGGLGAGDRSWDGARGSVPVNLNPLRAGPSLGPAAPIEYSHLPVHLQHAPWRPYQGRGRYPAHDKGRVCLPLRLCSTPRVA